jgi:hypothetical protein
MHKPGELEGPVKNEIEHFAYLIWEEEGRPEGRDKIHWIEAEDQWIATAMLN